MVDAPRAKVQIRRMASSIRVRVLGEGRVARSYIDAISTLGDLELSSDSETEALIWADEQNSQQSLEAVRTSPDLPVLIDPSVVAVATADPRTRAWLRSLGQSVLVAFLWRTAPVVRLAHTLLDAPRFVHVNATIFDGGGIEVAMLHVLDLVTHLMGRSPECVYAEASRDAASEIEVSTGVAGTLSFGAHGGAAFQINWVEGVVAKPVVFLNLTDGTRRITLTDFLVAAELAGFRNDRIQAALWPQLQRISDRPDVVQSGWDLDQGRADLLSHLAEAARTGNVPEGAPDLSGAVRTAALVRGTLATQGSGKLRRLLVL